MTFVNEQLSVQTRDGAPKNGKIELLKTRKAEPKLLVRLEKILKRKHLLSPITDAHTIRHRRTSFHSCRSILR